MINTRQGRALSLLMLLGLAACGDGPAEAPRGTSTVGHLPERAVARHVAVDVVAR
jgi:hypothetical protein